jgi:hypothetical protein
MPSVYRDASTVLADVPLELARFDAVLVSRVIVIGEAGRGRKSVAIMTPHETTATAIFAKGNTQKGWRGMGEGG